MDYGVIALIAFCIFLVLTTTLLAPPQSRQEARFWCLTGIFLGFLKVLLVMQTPQWGDVPPDALIYRQHAMALYHHWVGLVVPAADYGLVGYTQRYPSGTWSQESLLPYASVTGTFEWLYAASTILWQFFSSNWMFWAVMGNAAMAGATSGFAYLLTRELGAKIRVAGLAGLLVSLDPSMAINSAWLLKDSLAALLAVIALFCICRLLREPSWVHALTLGGTLGGLTGVRFVGFAVLMLLSLVVVCIYLYQYRGRRLTRLLVTFGVASIIWELVYFAPSIGGFRLICLIIMVAITLTSLGFFIRYTGEKRLPKAALSLVVLACCAQLGLFSPLKSNSENVAPSISSLSRSNSDDSTRSIGSPLRSDSEDLAHSISSSLNSNGQDLMRSISAPLQAQVKTLVAKPANENKDAAVLQWREFAVEHPVLAGARSIARTLAAPYPWVAITEGLKWHNNLELYMLGSLYWLIVLPGILVGILIASRTRQLQALLMLGALILLCTIYTVYFGEWSTRQRVFMTPVFYSFGAVGWHFLWTRLQSYREHGWQPSIG